MWWFFEWGINIFLDQPQINLILDRPRISRVVTSMALKKNQF
jgi:hypothetical protein